MVQCYLFTLKLWSLVPTRNSNTNLHDAKLGYNTTADSPTALVTQLRLAFRFEGFSVVTRQLSFSNCIPSFTSAYALSKSGQFSHAHKK